MTQIVEGSVDVVAALKGTEYEEVSSKLAAQFEKAGIVSKEQVHNAPLKLRKTYGVDLYRVMDFIMVYVEPLPKKRIKKE